MNTWLIVNVVTSFLIVIEEDDAGVLREFSFIDLLKERDLRSMEGDSLLLRLSFLLQSLKETGADGAVVAVAELLRHGRQNQQLLVLPEAHAGAGDALVEVVAKQDLPLVDRPEVQLLTVDRQRLLHEVLRQLLQIKDLWNRLHQHVRRLVVLQLFRYHCLAATHT